MSQDAYTVHTVRWSPWKSLGERGHLEFALVDLPSELGGGYYEPQAEGWAAVLIDRRLGRRQRKAALAHELVHDERGGGCRYDGMPPSWEVVAIRDEQIVNYEVARRLVPVDELQAFLDHHDLADIAVWEVAEHFDVPDDVVRRSLRIIFHHGT